MHILQSIHYLSREETVTVHALPCTGESAGAHHVSVGEQHPLGAQRTVLGGPDARVVLVGQVQHHRAALALCEAIQISLIVGGVLRLAYASFCRLQRKGACTRASTPLCR